MMTRVLILKKLRHPVVAIFEACQREWEERGAADAGIGADDLALPFRIQQVLRGLDFVGSNLLGVDHQVLCPHECALIGELPIAGERETGCKSVTPASVVDDVRAKDGGLDRIQHTRGFQHLERGGSWLMQHVPGIDARLALLQDLGRERRGHQCGLLELDVRVRLAEFRQCLSDWRSPGRC